MSGGEKYRHYRLRNYLNRNCENYPTHELGPIAQLLHINHGNRMVSLTSTSSKAAGLHEYITDRMGEEHELAHAAFAQGDVVTTVIRCAGGETITLTLDTTLPRYYSRDFTVRGTKGMYEEVTDSVFSINNMKHMISNGKNSGEMQKSTAKSMNIRCGNNIKKKECVVPTMEWTG